MKIENIKFLARGRRGEVFTGSVNGIKVAVKKRNPASNVETIERESKFLSKLNVKGIGPKFISYEKGELIYEFVEGEFIVPWTEKHTLAEIKKMLLDVFNQLFTMDILGINKQEMSHPLKHIIIGKKPVMIDFERARYTDKPSNVTQFCDFLMSNEYGSLLESKGLDIEKDMLVKLARKYKRNLSENDFGGILNHLNLPTKAF